MSYDIMSILKIGQSLQQSPSSDVIWDPAETAHNS